MAKERTPFTETNLYPIVFMVVLSLIFVGVLAVIYHLNLDRINSNQEIRYQASITSLFKDLLPENDSPSELFKTHFTELKLGERTYYRINNAEKTVGYCFVINGQGLWGSMQALLALTPELKTIINMDIYKHLETPGLGGRVEEEWFKNQFSEKPIVIGDDIIRYTLIPENSESANDNEMMQITGASRTSEGVSKMLFQEMESILKDFSEKGGAVND